MSVSGTLVLSSHPAQKFELAAEKVDLITSVGKTTRYNARVLNNNAFSYLLSLYRFKALL